MYCGVPAIIPRPVSRSWVCSSPETRLRQTEIEQLEAMRREEDVRRLEIAMNDAAAVQRGERVEHRVGQREGFGRWDGAAREHAVASDSPSSSSITRNG